MKKQTASQAAVSTLLVMTVASAWAHPGHGDESTLLGLLHMLEPAHLLPVLALVVVGLMLRRLARRSRDDKEGDGRSGRGDLPPNGR